MHLRISTYAPPVMYRDRWSYLQVNGFLWVFLGMAARGLWLVQREREEAQAADSPVGIESSAMAEVFST